MVKKVNPGKTYMLQYEPDEGYYSARNTEIGGEVLMLMMDGKLVRRAVAPSRASVSVLNQHRFTPP